jgi:diadenosine tetraphosphate (Ap4A) HIT family hydrolase
MHCELCHQTGGELVWQDSLCRVVLVNNADYPGYCRVIWAAHIKEMTDLAAVDQYHLMKIVFAVEACLRSLLQPDKLNLASIGNLTPHLHWHVIPRNIDDRHFPNTIWGERLRDSVVTAPQPGFVETLREALANSI